jgi:hypothetical protein
MKILNYIKSKFSKTMSVETFAAVLWEAFRRMRKCNIETYGKFSESVKEMNEEELMKLDWELSILDMFIITYCCRLHVADEGICNETLDKLHEFVYGDFLKIDKMLAYTFQEESKIKYQLYFEAFRSDDPFHILCKNVGKNIYGKEVYDAITLYALRIYIEANLKYMTDIIENITKKYDLEIVHG